MKVERILYGMQTADGKISFCLTSGVRSMLSQRSIDYIRNLKPQDSKKYLWFKQEQTIAYPVIYDVADTDPKHGGRTWIQNQTFLVSIHDFISYVLDNGNPFASLVQPELSTFPDFFEPINI